MKMKIEIRLILLTFMVMLTNIIMAQQEAMTAQYLTNKLFINPGYAGYRDAPNVVATYRSQWIGFKGAPQTSMIMFDKALKNDDFAVGGGMIYDKAGPASLFGISADFAYRARLTNRATLSFGMKASLDMYQVSLSDLALTSEHYGQVDDFFINNQKGVMLPNIGFGAYYFKRDQFIGVSIPRMIRNKLEKKGTLNYLALDGRQEPTIYIMAGKIYKINRDVKFQPNVLIKGEWGAPLSLGLFTNFLLMDQFTVGAFCHFKENMGLLFQWQMDKKLKVGYSVDFPTNAIIATNFGSHEITFTYGIATQKKRIVYPRYF